MYEAVRSLEHLKLCLNTPPPHSPPLAQQVSVCLDQLCDVSAMCSTSYIILFSVFSRTISLLYVPMSVQCLLMRPMTFQQRSFLIIISFFIIVY